MPNTPPKITHSQARLPTEIEFNRPKKYRLVSELGSGACGRTVHLRDEHMDLNLVAKKYSPIFEENQDPEFHSELLERFREEARILFQINHKNIVRVYNYFDYPESRTGFILMEHISGTEILNHLKDYPASADDVFREIIAAFAHLEGKGILHRDIRSGNILVTQDGTPKIIDFGFGKRVGTEETFGEKSISLNLWCEPPSEFSEGIYNSATEVYFIGKLFELAIMDFGLSSFSYKSLVRSMGEINISNRPPSFNQVVSQASQQKNSALIFSEDEKVVYQNFADVIISVLSDLYPDTKYFSDNSKVLEQLEELYQKVMLEDRIHNNNALIKVFLNGGYKYWRNTEIYVEVLKSFIDLLNKCDPAKRDIVLSNLKTRLDGLPRTNSNPYGPDDEIPF